MTRPARPFVDWCQDQRDRIRRTLRRPPAVGPADVAVGTWTSRGIRTQTWTAPRRAPQTWPFSGGARPDAD